MQSIYHMYVYVNETLAHMYVCCVYLALNVELMTQLMERDDLHMEQDSMLVDIEDLHR